MALPYTLVLYPDDGGWVMEIRELPGCLSQADTWDEVLPMIEDAKRLWLEVALDHGIPIPEPEPRSEATAL
jgi:antitoxin HicB